MNYSKKTALSLIALLLMLQIVTLFRSLPLEPVCGKVISGFGSANILVNCDSAVFMKDAQDPTRFFTGDSVYQDRPAHALVVAAISSTLKYLGIFNIKKSIIGNSGESTTYESTYYLVFLAINLILLLASTIFASKYLFAGRKPESFFDKYILCSALILLVAGNELTKTFFWTPHSQMFNILLPTAALYLIINLKEINTRWRFHIVLICLGFSLFLYPFLGLLYAILLFAEYRGFWTRLILIGISIVPYLSYPLILRHLGGEYENTSLSRYRQFIWTIEAFNSSGTVGKYLNNLQSYLLTFPVIPTFTIFIISVYFYFYHQKRRNSRFNSKLHPEILFAVFYFITLSLMGYYSRRLTLGPMIFVEIVLLRTGLSFMEAYFPKKKYWVVSTLVAFLGGSWVLTNGPLF
jgi:hypothetical protein